MIEPNNLGHPALLALVAALSAAAFVVLHEIVRRRIERSHGAPFHVALKVSRLWASAALVAVGFFCLAEHWHLWPRAFIADHPAHSWLRPINAFFLGHFIADLGWLYWGRWRWQSEPRTDLVIHHLVGIAAMSTAFAFDTGYAVLAVALTTEMMPVATGVIAWARLLGDRRLEKRGYRASLAISLSWRLPLWLLVLVVVSRNAFVLQDPSERLLYQLCIPIALALTVLDSIWVRHFLHTLETFEEPGPVLDTRPPLAPP